MLILAAVKIVVLTIGGLLAAQHNPRSPTQLADAIVERVLEKLKVLGRVQPDYTWIRGRRPSVWTLSRTTDSLVGREEDVAAVLDSLRQGAAFVWGGPGEGKTTVAMEAAARLHDEEPSLNGFELDMRGELQAWCCFLLQHRGPYPVGAVPAAALAASWLAAVKMPAHVVMRRLARHG